MKSLHKKLVERYEAMRSRQTLTKAFCLSLLELLSTLDADQSLIAQITQDLVRCNQLSAAAICSPASDNAAEILHSSNVDSDEEIEKILSSGTMMDEQMVDRVFKRITSRVEEHYNKATNARIPFGHWLFHLRSFDEVVFDQHIRTWISSLFSSVEASHMLYTLVLPGIVGSGCLTLADFVQLANQYAKRGIEKNESSNCRLKLDLLQSLLPDPELAQHCSISVRNTLTSNLAHT
jgi:mediator of RNA polymerase II transcription subunit 12